jgi:hypothetical protein
VHGLGEVLGARVPAVDADVDFDVSEWEWEESHDLS